MPQVNWTMQVVLEVEEEVAGANGLPCLLRRKVILASSLGCRNSSNLYRWINSNWNWRNCKRCLNSSLHRHNFSRCLWKCLNRGLKRGTWSARRQQRLSWHWRSRTVSWRCLCRAWPGSSPARRRSLHAMGSPEWETFR